MGSSCSQNPFHSAPQTSLKTALLAFFFFFFKLTDYWCELIAARFNKSDPSYSNVRCNITAKALHKDLFSRSLPPPPPTSFYFHLLSPYFSDLMFPDCLRFMRLKLSGTPVFASAAMDSVMYSNKNPASPWLSFPVQLLLFPSPSLPLPCWHTKL